jgi:hypothetical protein
MRLLLSALCLLSSTAFAQTLTLNGNLCTAPSGGGATVGSVNVDGAGNVTITTAPTNISCGSITPPPTISVPISASAASIVSGQTVSINWGAISPFAGATCTANGGASTNWSSTAINSANGSAGPYTLTTGANSSQVTFGISCTNGSGGSGTGSVTVTVNPSNGGTGTCPHTVPFPGTIVETLDFRHDSQPFPGTTVGANIADISIGVIKALRFTAPQQPIFQTAQIWSQENQNTAQRVTLAFHPIAGCIPPAVTNQSLPNCTFSRGGTVDVYWNQSPETRGGSCDLNPGGIYYANISHSTPEALAQSTCPTIFGNCNFYWVYVSQVEAPLRP